MKKFTLEDKINALSRQIDRLDILCTLIEEEDIEAYDEARLDLNVLTAILQDYEERLSELYL